MIPKNIQGGFIMPISSKLGDIWAYLEFPPDSPHVFQGINNEITPEEYYTMQNYNLSFAPLKP